MFESGSGGLPSAEELAARDEEWERKHPSVTAESVSLLDGLRGEVVAENRAAAAQLVRIGQLFRYRLSRCGDTESWCADTMEAVAAEVGAALGIGQRAALNRLHTARVMGERLPQVAAVFRAGDIGVMQFCTIAFRTDLIEDRQVLAGVDERIAANVTRWPSLSRGRLGAKVDAIVARVDADAVRRRAERAGGRAIEFDEDTDGFTHLRGTLFTPDARALDQRLAALAATVCRHDPRTASQRRADAVRALAARAVRMACQCGRTDCAAGKKPAASPAVIHMIADPAAVAGTGAGAAAMIDADGFLTPEVLAELATSAKRVPLVHPGYAAPEPRYRPSTALADFVRCRDLTCRWPGCEVPATRCHLDHTVPWAQGGPTHAANLKCYCPTHHLVKTFWGWNEKQLADGTLILTSPSGDTYVTTPGSALLFPSLCHAVGGMPAPETQPPQDYCGQRSAMMPTRRRTRTQDSAHRVAAERRANHQARTAAHTGPTDSTDWTDWSGPAPPDDDPPPF